MENADKTQAQLLEENKELLSRISKLEASESDLQRIKENLKKEKEKYQMAFEHTGTAMLVAEEDMSVNMANHRLDEVVGIPQEEAHKGRKWTEVVCEDELEKLKEFHKKRRDKSDDVPDEYEIRIKAVNGEIRDCLMNVSMIPGTKQSLISLIDITHRKKMMRKLQDSERKYRDLFENANDIIFTIDFDGNFTSANTAMVNTYGFTLEEILDGNIRTVVDPDYLSIAFGHIEEKLHGKTKTDPYTLLTYTKNGKSIWVEVSSRLITEDGKAAGVQGIARDVTERKLAEEKLIESVKRFRETTELLPGVICEMDFGMRLTYVNRKGLEIFGYSREEFEKGMNAKSLIHPDDIERVAQSFANIISGDYGVANEYKMIKRDGTIIHVLINTSPIIKGDKPCGVRSCILDITQRKQAQERLRQSEERFRSIFSQAPIGIALFVSDGNIVERNSSFGQMFGLSKNEDNNNFHLLDYLEISPQQLQGLKKGEGVFRESSFDAGEVIIGALKGQGTGIRYLRWCVTPLGSNEMGPSLFITHVQDITDQKLAEKAQLHEAHEETKKANRIVEGLKKEILQESSFQNIISRSPKMNEIFTIVPEMANSMGTVLISGESGTGKELIAQSLHNVGPRKSKPFIAVNCGALPENLLEAELFGYKAGAFTDAKKNTIGKFAAAEGGTIFFDEIGDISHAMQVKLLRVLQEREYEPLGSVNPVKTNVRVIAASNRNIEEMVREKSFREDLYYRINVLNIKLPPLHERKCDIPLLCDHFIKKFNARYTRDVKGITDDALDILLGYNYPGNIRELENFIEQAFIHCKSGFILAKHLSDKIAPKSFDKKVISSITALKSFKDVERFYIECMLTETSGNKQIAARRMGIHKATLYRKLRELDMVGFSGN